MSACLLTHGFSYLTDELYFMPADEAAPILSFTRPICIKSGAAAAISKLIPEQARKSQDLLMDKEGLILPHRLLNPDFSPISHPPALILFPRYQADAALKIDKISPAQVSTLLMSCDVNARNLPDHGFAQVVRIARTTPAYQLCYSSFEGIRDALDFAVSGWI